MLSTPEILEALAAYRYAGMFLILLISAMGLPIPEEVILVASGVCVGLGWAELWPACAACLLGVVAGDVYVYFLGRWCGPWFARTRLGRWLVRPGLAAKVQASFARHGGKTLFFGRFIPAVRFLVFFYSGQRRMSLARFLALDVPGAAIQAPLVLLAGVWCGRRIPDGSAAAERAMALVREGRTWLYAALAAAAVVAAALWLRARRRVRKAPGVAEAREGPARSCD